jgi:hypothetical protein
MTPQGILSIASLLGLMTQTRLAINQARSLMRALSDCQSRRGSGTEEDAGGDNRSQSPGIKEGSSRTNVIHKRIGGQTDPD